MMKLQNNWCCELRNGTIELNQTMSNFNCKIEFK